MNAPLLFDHRRLKTLQQHAAARYDAHSFLHQAAAERIADALDDIQRVFECGAVVGDYQDILMTALKNHPRLQTMHSSHFWRQPQSNIVLHEEMLPFKPASLDFIGSCNSLQILNDVVGHLVQARQALKPDGFYINAFFGGDTLAEAKECLAAAELALTGGMAARFHPTIFVKDAGMLLQRAGFALPVVTQETFTVTYSSFAALMKEIRGMASGNILNARQHNAPRELWEKATRLYQQRYADKNHHITATFQLLIMMGWAPSEKQQQPLKRGSAKVSLKDALL